MAQVTRDIIQLKKSKTGDVFYPETHMQAVIGLNGNKDANTVLAGPVSGSAGPASFRPLYPTDIIPLFTKEYTYKCTANDTNNGNIYFMNVTPTSNDWATPWSVHYTLQVDCLTSEDANSKYCHGFYDIYVGSAGSNYYYHVFNTFYSSSYYPVYYHKLLYHNTEAKYTSYHITNPVKLGARIQSAWGANTRTRIYSIKVYDYKNCTISFPENIEIYGDVYRDTYYNTIDWNATSTGLQETSDQNDTTTMNLYYTRLQAGTNGIKQSSLVMQDKNGKWQSFTKGAGGTATTKEKNDAEFRLGSRIYRIGRSSDLGADEYLSNGQVQAYYGLVDLRYSLNIVSNNSATGGSVGLTQYKPVYIVGTINSNGYFVLDDIWWTQDEPITEDGKIYIRVIDSIYLDNPNNPNGQYRGDLISDGNAYYYKNGSFQRYIIADSANSVPWSGVTGRPSFYDLVIKASDATTLLTYKPTTSGTYQLTLNKSNIGLGNVENTALSTWIGSNKITTVGTITSGTWNGSTIAIGKGGTGLTTYTKGDMLYASANNTLAKLGANTGTKKFLSMASSVPSWEVLATTDLPAMYIGKTAVKFENTTEQALTGISTGAFSSSITVGNGSAPASNEQASTTQKRRIYFGSSNYYIEVDKNGYLHTNVGFYSDSFVSAGGLSNAGGSSGIDSDALWELLAAGTSEQINSSHLPKGSAADLTSGTSTTGVAWGAKTIADYVTSQINTSISSALYFRGQSTTAITNGGTETATINGHALVAKTGDLVLYNGKEFAWDGSHWIQFGDESSWASKNISISTSGYLTGGGDLTTSRTISINTNKISDSSAASSLSSTSTNLVTERDIYYGLPTINNSHAYTSGTTIYAPTSAGTANQVLLSGGANTAPTWGNASGLSVGTASKLGSSTVGSTTKPIYLSSGTATECNTYAGGTAVTLNGTSKTANTASFYAPTSSGTSGHVLISGGANTAPSFRALVANDIPTLTWSKITVSASDIVTKLGNTAVNRADKSAEGTDIEYGFAKGGGVFSHTNALYPLALYSTQLNNAFYALDKRKTITATGFQGVNSNNIGKLFNNVWDLSIYLNAGSTGVLTIGAETDAAFTTYTYGSIYVKFYTESTKGTAKSVSIRAYGTKGGVVGWYDYDSTQQAKSTTGGTVENLFYATNSTIYNIKCWEITIVAHDTLPTYLSEVYAIFSRTNGEVDQSVVTKFANAQTLYGAITIDNTFSATGNTTIGGDLTVGSSSANKNSYLWGDVVLPNTKSIVWKNSGGNNAYLLGFNSSNNFVIGTSLPSASSGGDLYLKAKNILLQYGSSSTTGITLASTGAVTIAGATTLSSTLAVASLSTLSGGISLGTQYTPSGASSTVDSKLVWDNTNKAWHLIGNFYADGFISAGGLSNSSGGGGVDIDAVWASLTNSVTDEYASTRIAQSHLPAISSSGSGVVSAIAYSGSGNSLVLSVTKTAVVTSLGSKTGTITLSGGLSIDSNNVLSSTDNKVTQTATTTSAAYELLFSSTADNTTRTEGARKTSTLTYNPSTKVLSTGGAVNGLTLSAQTTGFKISGGTTSKTLTVGADYTLGAACAKAIVTEIDTSASLPTSNAVKTFVEGKGYTTNTGTVKSVTLTSGTGITVSDSGTAITSTGSRTISLNVSGAKTALGLGTMAYEAKADYVLLATAQTISAKHTFSSGILLNTASSWTSSDRAIAFSADGEDANIRYYLTSDSKGLTFNPSTGELKAAKFTRRGGTSSQFLKADGSTDSNTYLTSHQALYNLVINNSAGIAQITYKPGTSGTYSLTLTKTMVGLGNVDNLAASDYFTAISSNTSTPLSITVGGTTKTLSSLYATTAERPRSISGTAEAGGYNLNTILAGGGAIRNVSSSSYWAHAPQGLNYFGAAIQVNPTNHELGAMQFAYNITYNGTTPTDKIWWRARNNDGWADDWHLIYDSATLTKSVITGLLGNTTYASYHPDGYLPLSGGTMTGSIKLPNGSYINAESGYTMLGIGSGGENFYCGPGAEITGSFLIRSGNIDLTHHKAGTPYKIWDASNSNLSTVDWAANNLTVAGTSTFSDTMNVENRKYMYWKDSGGTYRNVFGLNNSNELLIGYGLSSVTGSVTALYGETIRMNASSVTELVKTGGGATLLLRGSALNNAPGTILFRGGTADSNGFKIEAEPYGSYGRVSLSFYSSNVSSGDAPYTPDWKRSMRIYYNGNIHFGVDGAFFPTVYSYGPVTIGTTTNNANLNVRGTITSTGDQVISSDAALKKNLKDLNLTVEQIAQLPAVTFDWKDGRGSSFGTVAQSVLPIFPQAVRGEEGNYSVVYGQGGWVFGVKNARAIVDIQKHETEQDKEIRELNIKVKAQAVEISRLKELLKMN